MVTIATLGTFIIIQVQLVYWFICVAVTCFDLPVPDNGRVVYSALGTPYDFGTQATYICDSGFGLNGGDEVRSCAGGGSSTNGTWSGRATTCEGIANILVSYSDIRHTSKYIYRKR